jgi:hypothetical protein
MKLLNIDSNAKTVKGQKQGYMTAVLYLAPWKASGLNVCPMAEIAGCIAGCLNTAGRGGMAPGNATFTAEDGQLLPDNAIQRCRIRRTQFYARDRAGFMAQLVTEIAAFIRKAARRGLVPVVRLNGTSDIRWELIPVQSPAGEWYPSIFECFGGVQFYDYTKISNRKVSHLGNYALTFSYSAATAEYTAHVEKALAAGMNIAAVFRTKNLPETFLGRAVICGDETDLRFTDPAGVVVGLYAKGKARKDFSGFVVDTAA